MSRRLCHLEQNWRHPAAAVAVHTYLREERTFAATRTNAEQAARITVLGGQAGARTWGIGQRSEVSLGGLDRDDGDVGHAGDPVG